MSGIHGSIGPFAVPMSESPQPHWNTATITP